MMNTRNKLVVTGLKVFGTFAFNSWIVYEGWKQQKQNHEIYKNMPEDKQREVYNNCVLQKVGSNMDGISAIQERMYQTDSSSHKDIQPRKPFTPPK